MLHDAPPVPLEFAPLDVRHSTFPPKTNSHSPWRCWGQGGQGLGVSSVNSPEITLNFQEHILDTERLKGCN